MARIVFVLMKAHVRKGDNRRQGVVDDRIDIAHQCILALLDSPLNQAGELGVLVHTVDNVLIEINCKARIPRSVHRFRGLMQQLFTTRKIKSSEGEVLMKIVKNPVSEHLPPNCIKFGLSQNAPVIDRAFFLEKRSHGYAVFLNANQKGEDVFPEAEFSVKLSNYPLSAFVCCTKVCGMLEEIYEIF